MKPMGSSEGGAPILKPGAPKKETTRIQMPPEPKTMPKATVKLQQTVPMAPMPVPAIRTAVEGAETETQQDPLLVPLGILAAFSAAFAAAAAFLASTAFN